MKYILFLLVCIPISVTSQTDERYWNRELIDSIHSKRLCTCYPGLTRIQTTKEAYDESILVFTGKVIEIIRIEKTDTIFAPPPPPLPEGHSDTNTKISTQKFIESIDPVQHYWYVLKPIEVFKGEEKETYKVYSKIFSNISPLLMLDKTYLIYAVEPEVQEYPYVYCNGNSCHIEYAQEEISELKELIKQ